MAVLLIAEHDNASLKPATLNAVTAAKAIGGDLVVLVAGQNCRPAAKPRPRSPGSPRCCWPMTRPMPIAWPRTSPSSSWRSPAATAISSPPRPAAARISCPAWRALLDVAQISDISAVESPDTFVRTIYAGNALATVQSADKIKVVTVRMTGFDPAPAEPGEPRGDPFERRGGALQLRRPGAEQERAARAHQRQDRRLRRARHAERREFQAAGGGGR